MAGIYIPGCVNLHCQHYDGALWAGRTAFRLRK